LARNKGVAPGLLRRIERLVFRHQKFLEAKFDEVHRG